MKQSDQIQTPSSVSPSKGMDQGGKEVSASGLTEPASVSPRAKNPGGDLSDHDRLIFYAARHAYQNRMLLTSKGVSWSNWFRDMFGITLDEYVAFAIQNKVKERL